ncbi:LITAF-like zinc ribbon domain-containing protein [Sphaerosporella brunnea]|uniref:LITAF-like zinc ribbon domain-containing protein n=1 Tax=Sphaerosporella brunnea TaxID=1250544 RepID=A0A5J5EV88_9PEZI|nr:LITAF-like zinc ribbon domain-containing protein [Sphaerosporella brunnea]
MEYSQQPQQGIPMVPQQPAPVYEKAPQQQAYPQQQQHVPMQPQPMVQAQGHQYLTAMPLGALSRSPAPVDCPSCGVRGLTTCAYQSGDSAHLWALIFCFLICAPCIPYVVKSFKDVQHSCGSCGVPLALWHKSGGVDILIFS